MNKLLILPQKRVSFNIMAELFRLENIMIALPENEVFKLISCGHFSSIAFIKYIANKTKINCMYASTLKVGKKHIAVLDELHRKNKLIDAHFVVGSIMKRVDTEYRYFDIFESICNKNNWPITVSNNHSKVLIFDTEIGKFVLETSSNLNENPSIEQFSFEKNEQLYKFYLNYFKEVEQHEC